MDQISPKACPVYIVVGAVGWMDDMAWSGGHEAQGMEFSKNKFDEVWEVDIMSAGRVRQRPAYAPKSPLIT